MIKLSERTSANNRGLALTKAMRTGMHMTINGDSCSMSRQLLTWRWLGASIRVLIVLRVIQDFLFQSPAHDEPFTQNLDFSQLQQSQQNGFSTQNILSSAGYGNTSGFNESCSGYCNVSGSGYGRYFDFEDDASTSNLTGRSHKWWFLLFIFIVNYFKLPFSLFRVILVFKLLNVRRLCPVLWLFQYFSPLLSIV